MYLDQIKLTKKGWGLLMLFIALAGVLLSGCETTSSGYNRIAPYYRQYSNTSFQSPRPATTVRILEYSRAEMSFDKLADIGASYVSKGYELLGHASFDGQMVPPHELQQFVGSVGGDLVIRVSDPSGSRRLSRMAPAYYTPSSTSYSSANLQDASGRTVGYGSSETRIPSTTTYARQSFDMPTFAQQIVVLRSGSAQ